MIPIIKKADGYLQWAYGSKWLVGDGRTWDMCDNLGTAFRYWLWWCGVPVRIAFCPLTLKNILALFSYDRIQKN